MMTQSSAFRELNVGSLENLCTERLITCLQNLREHTSAVLHFIFCESDRNLSYMWLIALGILTSAANLCSDECFKARDGQCDDLSFCVFGTDCTDCGDRGAQTPRPTDFPSSFPTLLFINESEYPSWTRRPTTRRPAPTYLQVDDPELPPATARPTSSRKPSPRPRSRRRRRRSG